MEPELLAAVIGTGGALLGAGVGGLVTYRVAKLGADRDENRRLQEYAREDKQRRADHADSIRRESAENAVVLMGKLGKVRSGFDAESYRWSFLHEPGDFHKVWSIPVANDLLLNIELVPDKPTRDRLREVVETLNKIEYTGRAHEASAVVRAYNLVDHALTIAPHYLRGEALPERPGYFDKVDDQAQRLQEQIDRGTADIADKDGQLPPA